MELIKAVNISTKEPGQDLTSREINSMVSTVNNLVDVTNIYLKKYCDINVEYGNTKKQFNLTTAVTLVPLSRRSIGMKIKFFDLDEKYSEYYFTGMNTEESTWNNVNNWSRVAVDDILAPDPEEKEDIPVGGGIIIDGGEWTF